MSNNRGSRDYASPRRKRGRRRHFDERKEALDALERLEASYRIVADNTYDWEFWLSPEGSSLYVSPSCRRITGHNAGEFLSDPGLFLRIVHPDDRCLVAEHLQERCRGERSFELEFRIIRPDGAIRWIGHACQPVFSNAGEFLGTRGSNRDITGQREAQAALQKAREELERHVQDRTAALTGALNNLMEEIGERQKAEEALWESRERFERVLDSLDALVYVADMETYRLLLLNRYGRKIWGDITGEICWQRLQAGQTGPCSFCTNGQLLDADGRPSAPVVWEFRNTVTGRWYECRDQAIRWTDGRMVRMEIATDITDRRLSEEKVMERDLEYLTLLQSAMDGFCVVDATGRFLDVNDAYCRVSGYSRDELLGMSLSDLDASLGPAEISRRIVKILRSGSDRFETRQRHRDGHLVDIEMSVTFVPHGGGRLFGFLRDVTERKRAEAEIRTLNAELEERVRQRTAQLEAINSDLAAFSHTVSHDLRTPLVWIGGYSRSILKHHSEKLDEQSREFLREICEGTQRMEQLIDTLLNFSQLTYRELHREPVDISTLAKTVISELMKNQPRRMVTFLVTEGIIVNGDADLLRVVLKNLLGNAWKYSGRRVDAVIEFGVFEREGEEVCYVRDNGTGFDMAAAERIFIPFQRLHDAGEFTGHGVGLATVKRIINHHGGEIWAESVPGCGATFYFTLGGRNVSDVSAL